MSRTQQAPRRRADAERNIARIRQAARRSLSRNPDASIDEIAREAGVGRVTLYGHFSSRAKLIEAAVVEALAEGDKVLAAVDLAGDPREALRRLVEASWRLTAESMSLLQAAQGVLSPRRIRDLHADPVRRAADLLRRGQAEGVFRTDLPADWLVSVLHSVMKGAVVEIEARRLKSDQAANAIAATVLAAWSDPDRSDR
jgi:TetR/AcrR family transcriptional regulator, mexCD-oprJ operon repressor